MVRLTKRVKTSDKKPVDYQTELKKLMAAAQLGSDKDREPTRIFQLMAQFMMNIETYFGGIRTKDQAVYELGREKIREGMELIWESFGWRKK